MSLGSTSESIGYEIIFGLALLASLPVVLPLSLLLRWILGIRSGWFSVIFIGLIYIGGLVGTSYYLDTVGTVVDATVTKKEDVIVFRDEGDWQHDFQVHVRYPATSGSEAASFFRTSESYFDSLHLNGPVQVRRVSFNGWFDIARFADQSTWTWIPWKWVGIGLSVVLLGWLGWKLFDKKIGCLLLIALLLVFVCTLFGLKYIEWRNSENPSRTPLQATGTVEKVQRVIRIDPMPSKDSHGEGWDTSIDVAQLYDIVVVRYTPQGYEEPILAVDAVDADERQFSLGDAVEISYASADPRTVRLANQSRFHHIRNPIEWVKQQLLAIGFIVGLFLLLSGIGNAWRRMIGRKLSP